MRTILITTAHGMFGGALLHHLRGRDGVRIRAMVRSRGPEDVDADGVEFVEADLDRPETLAAVAGDLTDVFLVTPMDERVEARERAVVDAVATASPGARVMKLHGAVDHAGDALSQLHEGSIEHLKASGLVWTLLSPNSVMETSLLPFVDTIEEGAVFGTSGDGRVGLVALDDCARVGAAAITSDDDFGQELVVTGPEALAMSEVCERFTEALGRTITYYDLPEKKLTSLLVEHGGFPDEAAVETAVLCHYRAWRRGGADVVTDTVERVTGSPSVRLDEWIGRHMDAFGRGRGAKDHVLGWLLRLEFGKYAHRPA